MALKDLPEDGDYIVVLPTNPPELGNVDFAATTFYHWPQFSQNLTERGVILNSENFTSVEGPVLFQQADHLKNEQKQCLVDKSFHDTSKIGHECIQNPFYCGKGLSFSVFYLADYPEEEHELLNRSKTFNQEFLVSSGGEHGTPGFAIYRRGANIGALVSTGNLTWSLEVEGAMPPKDKWSNIAIRWEKPRFSTEEEFHELLGNGVKIVDMGGLQLFVNLEPIGHVLQAEVLGCVYDKSLADFHCQDNPPSPNDPFDPPEISLGCHRSPSNPVPRNFVSGSLDELAIWNRRLNNTELPYFLGGFKEELSDITTDQLLKLIQHVDMSDPHQAEQVINIMGSIVETSGDKTKDEFRNIYPTETTTLKSVTTASGSSTNSSGAGMVKEKIVDTKELRQMLKISEKLVNVDQLSDDQISEKEFNMRIKAFSPIAEIISNKGRFASQWKELEKDPNIEGSHRLNAKLTDYIVHLAERRLKVIDPIKNISFNAEFDQVISTDNYAIQISKTRATKFRSSGSRGYFEFPVWKRPDWEKVAQSWGTRPSQEPIEKVMVPNSLFTGDCESKDVTFVGSMIDDFPDSGLKNPAFIRANRVELDSRVITIDVSANKPNMDRKSHDYLNFGRRCQVDPKLLLASPYKLTFATMSHRNGYGSPIGRKTLSYFDSLDDSLVRKRHCAVWNPDIGVHGGWDTAGLKMTYESDSIVSCEATVVRGSFGIVAEIEDPASVDDDHSWLFVLKMIGYVLSIIALMIFIACVLSSTYLWEMFHSLGLNIALALLLADIFMLVTEINAVRDNRDLCCTFGSLMSFFYIATSSLLAMECYAVFRAITNGVIGGRTKMYLSYGWGIPFVALGYNIFANLDLMGDDPRCMMGWDNAPKWAFFIPVLTLCSISLILILIAVCNIATPAMRKESIVEEMGSIVKGVFFFVLFFCVTWSMAPLAYVSFPDSAMPDFYPAFQVLNSFSGVFFLVFVGIMSQRFRTVMTGKVIARKNQLINGSLKNTEDDDKASKIAGSVTSVQTQESSTWST